MLDTTKKPGDTPTTIVVTKEDFEVAFVKVKPSVSKKVRFGGQIGSHIMYFQY